MNFIYYKYIRAKYTNFGLYFYNNYLHPIFNVEKNTCSFEQAMKKSAVALLFVRQPCKPSFIHSTTITSKLEKL